MVVSEQLGQPYTTLYMVLGATCLLLALVIMNGHLSSVRSHEGKTYATMLWFAITNMGMYGATMLSDTFSMHEPTKLLPAITAVALILGLGGHAIYWQIFYINKVKQEE